MTAVALYCRQSRTREGVSASIAVQRAELEALASRRGWTVAGIYEDPDAPADDLDARSAWVQLLVDADAGKFDVVAGYDASRLWRSVELRVVTCRMLADAGVERIATLSGDTPTDGADDPEGELVGNLLASVAQFDNALRAKKVRAAHDRAAREGKAWRGRRPFGYTASRREVVDREAKLIREAADRVIRGEAVSGIVTDWNNRGVTTAYGKPWRRITLTRMLRSPSLAGVRVHRDRTYPGQWTPILTIDTHARVVAALDARLRPRGGPGTPRLLTSSGLLRCGAPGCGARMRATVAPNGKRQYGCPSDRGCGGVSVLAERAEGEVRDQVLSVLDDELVEQFVAQAAEADSRVEAAHATLASLSKRRALVGRTLVRVGDADAARAALDELDRLEADAQRDIKTASTAVGLVLAAAADPEAWWDAESTDMLDRRGLLEALCHSIRVLPSTAGAFTWDPERIVVDWRV